MQLVLGEMHQLLFTDTQISAQKAIDAGYVFQFPTANLALRNCLN
jgi:NAD dependent epimerase/dehydratase family enzyme